MKAVWEVEFEEKLKMWELIGNLPIRLKQDWKVLVLK